MRGGLSVGFCDNLLKLGPSFLPLGGSSGPAVLSGRRPSRLRLGRTSVAEAVGPIRLS